jgi:serine/threonine protein kinase
MTLKRKATIDFEHWTVLKVLGQGAYGNVLLVSHESFNRQTEMEQKSYYAMKVYDKQKIIESNLSINTMNERMILIDASHPYVLKLHYSFQSSQSLYFIMDFVEGGDLFQQIKKSNHLNEKAALFYGA